MPRKPQDLLVEPEVDTVDVCVLGERNGKLEGVHDAGGGRPKGGNRLVRNVRLHLQKLFSLDDAQSLDTIGEAPGKKGQQPRAIILGRADHKRADRLVVDAELLAQRRHQSRALHI